MSEFKVIETQEQLDKVIGERIRRAEEKAAEKYSDYEAIKTQNEEYVKQIAQLQEATKGNQGTINELKAQVQNYESSSLKTKIALEIGLPYQMAGRLSGNNEEEIRADAEAMAKLIGNQKPVAPIGSNEPVVTNPKDAAWSKLVAELGDE